MDDLRKLTIANKRVHPDVGGLSLVLHADDAVLARWLERLRAELPARARART